MEVIVPDDQLSLAIGKNGQNVRLAVKLTGWKIDVKSESIAATQEEEGHRALMKIPNIDEATAEHLFNQGLKSIAAIAAADVESLSSIPGINGQKASVWIEEAGKMINQENVVADHKS
jgi:N utilization substance protein A